MRVLIVDEDHASAELYRGHIADLGHTAVVAGDATTADAAVTKNPPDAVLLSLGVPGINGVEFLQHDSLRQGEIPVVAMSGSPNEIQTRECLRLGAIDCLQKPIAPAQLTELVGFLELHVLNRQLADQVRRLDRRRAIRVPSAFPLRIIEYTGAEWLGVSVDVSAFGVKVRTQGAFRDGAVVKLHFTPPDGPPSLTLTSVLVRTDPDGQAFNFVNLTVAEFQRLSGLVKDSAARTRA